MMNLRQTRLEVNGKISKISRSIKGCQVRSHLNAKNIQFRSGFDGDRDADLVQNTILQKSFDFELTYRQSHISFASNLLLAAEFELVWRFMNDAKFI